MTLQELCAKYNVTESSVKSNFVRTQKSIQKKHGVLIKKIGRGASATYEEDTGVISDKRALTMYDETHAEIVFNRESLNLMNADFLIFLGVVCTPMGMFRGTPEEFLNYIGVGVNRGNLEMLEYTLLDLVDRELINYDTDEDVIILYIRRKAEKEMHLGIEMIKHCREIAEKNNKHRDAWLKLMKVWVSIQICSENQPFTSKDIERLTGLSKKQVTEYKRLLEQDEMFKTTRVGEYGICYGTNVTLNGFYN